jgi:hypothetical protein
MYELTDTMLSAFFEEESLRTQRLLEDSARVILVHEALALQLDLCDVDRLWQPTESERELAIQEAFTSRLAASKESIDKASCRIIEELYAAIADETQIVGCITRARIAEQLGESALLMTDYKKEIAGLLSMKKYDHGWLLAADQLLDGGMIELDIHTQVGLDYLKPMRLLEES